MGLAAPGGAGDAADPCRPAGADAVAGRRPGRRPRPTREQCHPCPARTQPAPLDRARSSTRRDHRPPVHQPGHHTGQARLHLAGGLCRLPRDPLGHHAALGCWPAGQRRRDRARAAATGPAGVVSPGLHAGLAAQSLDRAFGACRRSPGPRAAARHAEDAGRRQRGSPDRRHPLAHRLGRATGRAQLVAKAPAGLAGLEATSPCPPDGPWRAARQPPA